MIQKIQKVLLQYDRLISIQKTKTPDSVRGLKVHQSRWEVILNKEQHKEPLEDLEKIMLSQVEDKIKYLNKYLDLVS